MSGQLPRIPYGLARRIVLALRLGDQAIVRPEYIISFRKAAREAGRRVITNAFWTATGEKRIRMMAVRRSDWITGHIYQRLPARDADTGHFLKDNAA